MVSKSLLQKVLAVSSASILAFSMPAMTVFAYDDVETPITVDSTTPSEDQVVIVESITVDEGQSAIVVSVPEAQVTVNGDVTSSGTAYEYTDELGNTYKGSYDAVVAQSGTVSVGGDVNANGDEQIGVNAVGSGTTVSVDGTIAANGSGINAYNGATVSAGSVNSAGNAINVFGEAQVTVNGNAYSTGMKDYYSEWDEEKGEWVVIGESYRGTGISTDGTADIVVDGNLQGATEGINIHRGLETPNENGSIVVTGKVSVASDNATRIYIGNSYDSSNQTVTYETTQDVLDSIPAIYLYELDKPYIWVGRAPEDGSSTESDITDKVVESINYIIKKDSALDATITNADDDTSIGALTINGTDYNTVNIGKAFKVAAALDDGYTLSGGSNVSVEDNGDGTFTLRLTNPLGGINIKAVLRPVPAPASDNSSDDSGERYEVVVQEVTPADEDPNQAPAGAIVVANNAGSEDANPATAAISGDKPARTVSYSIASISPIQYKTSIIENVTAAPAGGALNIETDRIACFDTKMIEAIAARSDIDVNVVFTYGGKKLKVTIPAGYDVRSLLDEHGYCGFLRLMAILGSTEL
ncbi:MAG: hypothetical protein J6M92_16815 [Oribacterium sp.]|nr:hypothetical protein [Oribacterium sp.]